jgi:hypothetical protein
VSDESLNPIDAAIRLARTKSDLHATVDALTERDVTVLVIGYRAENDDTSHVRVVRHAHGFESIGLLRYALEDELNATARKSGP